MKSLSLPLLLSVASYLTFAPVNAELLNTASQPTIGSPLAKVQVVAFLEPKCPDSKRYNNTSFPKLKAEFIDSNKIRYTVITTSFLNKSMPAADALLCVYDQESQHPHTDMFFKYLDYIYLNQPPEKEDWATISRLLKFAADAIPNVDQNKLKSCIEGKRYQSQVVKNTAFGINVMGEIHTPTIYVNGMKVENKDDTIDYDKLKSAINQALQ